MRTGTRSPHRADAGTRIATLNGGRFAAGVGGVLEAAIGSALVSARTSVTSTDVSFTFRTGTTRSAGAGGATFLAGLLRADAPLRAIMLLAIAAGGGGGSGRMTTSGNPDSEGDVGAASSN
jgi:hypothetical protein